MRNRIGAVAAALIAAAVSACGKQAGGDAAPAPDVGVAQVVSREVRHWDEFTGRVAAVETVELRPRVSGYVERVAYREGDEVAQGDLLFVIDQRRYRAARDGAAAALERARADARLAQSQDARAQALLQGRAISREDAEARRAAVAQTAAAVRAAEAALANAALDLEFTHVRAPIAGRTGRALVTVGNLAQADATVLTTLVSLDPVYVYFDGDDAAHRRYHELARKGERAATGNPVRVALVGDAGFPHAGTLDFIDNRIDADTGTMRARARLANPSRALTPGLFARVQLEGSGAFAALLIDEKAVLTDQDRRYVYVLDANNAAQRRDIVLGRRADGLRIVESGLAADDRIVVQGVQKIFAPGTAVAPRVVAMGAAAGAATAGAASKD